MFNLYEFVSRTNFFSDSLETIKLGKLYKQKTLQTEWTPNFYFLD